MRAKPPTYHPGLEFYRSAAMGLVGVQNKEDGSTSTYGYLSDDEAAAWLDAWLKDEDWVRP